jgi:hypothetical protein
MIRMSASARDQAKAPLVDSDVDERLAAEELWAIGHLVNHPPKGIMPNVETKPIDLTKGPQFPSLPDDDRYYGFRVFVQGFLRYSPAASVAVRPFWLWR